MVRLLLVVIVLMTCSCTSLTREDYLAYGPNGEIFDKETGVFLGYEKSWGLPGPRMSSSSIGSGEWFSYPEYVPGYYYSSGYVYRGRGCRRC